MPAIRKRLCNEVSPLHGRLCSSIDRFCSPFHASDSFCFVRESLLSGSLRFLCWLGFGPLHLFSLSRLCAVVFFLIVTVIIIIVVTIAKLMVIKKGILLLCIISRSWLESLFSCLFPLAFRKWLFCPLSFAFVASGSIMSDAFKHDEYYWEVTDDFKTRGFQFDVPAALAWGTAGHRGAAPQAGLAEAEQAFCAK